MKHPLELAARLRAFDDGGDGSARKSRELALQLLACSPRPFAREQYEPGHVTATALVLHPERPAVLLVHHRRLERWLLPGGHVEPEDDSIGGAARREAREETGVRIAAPDGPVAGVDVHGIPPKKKEPFHLHHDVIVAFRAADAALECSEESFATAWCGEDEFDRYALPESIRLAYARARGKVR
jgi:8-oxo-dGTP pyrophosphatase MutT (NUDIX family)